MKNPSQELHEFEEENGGWYENLEVYTNCTYKGWPTPEDQARAKKAQRNMATIERLIAMRIIYSQTVEKVKKIIERVKKEHKSEVVDACSNCILELIDKEM